MNEELKKALAEMQTGLEGKSKEQIDAEVKAFTEKFNKEIEAQVKELAGVELKSVKETLEGERKTALDAMQKHLDTMDVKLQARKAGEKAGKDNILKAVTDNFDKIKTVNDSKVNIKAVGNMTTANLTGDEPRDYNFDVVMFPGQKVNVSDLAGSIQISGGTYTYTREVTGEGSISTQTEGSSKSQIDYDFLNVDVATDFIAGFARYSKKMRNNLPYLESFIPKALRRDYFKAENVNFNAVLAAAATASTEIITGKTKAEMLINDMAKQENTDYDVQVFVVKPLDYHDILKTPKDDLAAIVTFEGGILRINGIQVLKATWLTANKYFVGDWSRINKINTEGLSLAFSDVEGTNFVTNSITARIESQTALAVEQPTALIYGDFTAI